MPETLLISYLSITIVVVLLFAIIRGVVQIFVVSESFCVYLPLYNSGSHKCDKLKDISQMPLVLRDRIVCASICYTSQKSAYLSFHY